MGPSVDWGMVSGQEKKYCTYKGQTQRWKGSDQNFTPPPPLLAGAQRLLAGRTKENNFYFPKVGGWERKK